MKRGFASDNNAGIHPEILKAISEANHGHTVAYGNDPHTERAVKKMKGVFGEDTDIYFVFIGTAANVLGLDAVTKPYHSVLCAQTSHVHEDECGAPERWTGCKVIALPTDNGKLTLKDIEKEMHGIDFEHHSQPRVISVTQTTEVGTVYTLEEQRVLADFAHENNMLLHMDGARISNAAAWLGTGFAECTRDVGVDVLSFGGTKNGMMYGEAVIFFNTDHSGDFKYLRKQGMQLASKMRFIAVQFERFLQDDLWLNLATHSNRMAKKLESAVKEFPEVKITQEVQSNIIFAIIPREITAALQEEYFFYVRNEHLNEVRWMCSYDTTGEDIEGFVGALRRLLGR